MTSCILTCSSFAARAMAIEPKSRSHRNPFQPNVRFDSRLGNRNRKNRVSDVYTKFFLFSEKCRLWIFPQTFFSLPPPLHPDRASLEKCDRQYGALSYILDIKDSRSYIIATRGINNGLTRAGLLVWLSSIALPRWLHCRTVYSAWNRFVLNKWKITGSDLSAVLTLTR